MAKKSEKSVNKPVNKETDKEPKEKSSKKKTKLSETAVQISETQDEQPQSEADIYQPRCKRSVAISSIS